MITATRRIEFDAGHRVLGHGGACRHLHGHRYAAEVTVRAQRLDGLGMVVDFGVIKTRVGGWVAAHLDHNMILHCDDPLAELFRSSDPEEQRQPDSLFAGKAPFLMDANPTAENLAELICLQAAALMPDGIVVVAVRVFETPSCWADFVNK